jgi:hypothetical protein
MAEGECVRMSFYFYRLKGSEDKYNVYSQKTVGNTLKLMIAASESRNGQLVFGHLVVNVADEQNRSWMKASGGRQKSAGTRGRAGPPPGDPKTAASAAHPARD